MKKSLIFILVIFSCTIGNAQNNENDWLPVFDSGFPKKFFSVKLNSRFDYRMSSTSSLSEIGDGFTEVRGDRIATIDLKFPVVNRPNFKLTGGLKYIDEELSFDDDDGDVNYPLYVSLEDRNLKNLGGNLNGLFHLKGNRSIVARSSFALAGDFYRNSESFSFSKLLKFSMAVGYGVKPNASTFYAFGVYTGYTFGRPSVYPAFVWVKRFPNNAGFDALLPQSFKIWKKINQNIFIYANTKITGTSYTVRLSNSILEEAESLQLRSSFIISSFGITSRLSKWLWIEGEAGFSNNLSFNISETNFIAGSLLPKPNKDYLIKSKIKASPFVSISLFLAPPSEFLNKYRN